MPIKEVRRPKHNYVCSKERTVVRRAVLTRMEVRAPSTSCTTKCCRCYLEGQSGIGNYWTGILEWPKLL